MERMIDEGELIKVLEERATNEAICGYMTAYDVTNSIIDEVKEQPTAYDPDKVVEQLENMKSTYQRLHDLKDRDYLKYGYIIETLIDVIKIMKGGGVE